MKSIFNKEQSVLVKYFSNDNFIKIFSVVVALLLFFSINGFGGIFTKYFLTTTYISGVPLSVEYDDDQYIINGLPEEITVSVSGGQSSVNAAKKQANLLTANLKVGINSEGKKTINSKDVTFSNLGAVNIKPLNDSFDIDVQKKVTKEMQIKSKYVNVSELTKGVMLDTPSLSQDTVKIEGGSKDIESIESVYAIIDLKQIEDSSQADTASIKADLIAYDEKGIPVPSVVIAQPTIDVQQAYEVNTRTVSANYIPTNLPSNKYVASVCDKESIDDCKTSDGSSYNSNVNVFGDKSAIDELSKVDYKIDLESKSDSQLKVTATAILPEGVFTTESSKEVIVTLEKGMTKTIKNIPVRTNNLPSGVKVKTTSSENARIDVKVTGAESIVKDMTEDDLSLYIDLTGAKAGQVINSTIKVSASSLVEVKPAKKWIEITVVKDN
ncbi:MAG: YbbR-like domain-containing protein [Mycoplasmatales bacterium]